MKITIKLEAAIKIKEKDATIEIRIPSDISEKKNAYDAYAEGYYQAFNDIAQEIIESNVYGANTVTTLIRTLNEKSRDNSIEE